MFSVKRAISAGFMVLLSLGVFAGCKTGKKNQTVTPAVVPAAPQVTPTNPPPHVAVLPPDSGDNMAANILAWGTTSEVYRAKPGELKAPFTFNLTNVSSGPVMIWDASTSCDCTVASLPAKPWTLQSGEAGKIEASIDLSKKAPGEVTNSIIVFTSQGNRRLWVKAIVPEKPN
jgi:hypothetical protein